MQLTWEAGNGTTTGALLWTRCAQGDHCGLRGLGGRTGRAEQHVQTFGTTVGDLLLLRDWLAAHGVTHVAMESTGVYWKNHEPSAHHAE